MIDNAHLLKAGLHNYSFRELFFANGNRLDSFPRMHFESRFYQGSVDQVKATGIVLLFLKEGEKGE